MPLPDACTGATIFAPPEGGTFAEIEAALLRLLITTEPHEPDAPAAVAYRTAMRRYAVQALAAGSAHALDYPMARIRQDDPARADAREAILSAAWEGLPGLRS